MFLHPPPQEFKISGKNKNNKNTQSGLLCRHKSLYRVHVAIVQEKLFHIKCNKNSNRSLYKQKFTSKSLQMIVL